MTEAVDPGLNIIRPLVLPINSLLALPLCPAGKTMEFGALGRVVLAPTLLSLIEMGKISGRQPLIGWPPARHCDVAYTVPVVEGVPVISPVMGVPTGIPDGVVEE